MAGALRRRSSDDRTARSFALMTAYFGGLVPNCDAKLLPSWQDWHVQVTGEDRRKISKEEAIHRLDLLAVQGLIVKH